MPVVSSLFCYPIKSCRGLSLPRLELDRRGPKHDRRWMVVSPKGRFITLRENALMAQIQPEFDEQGQLWVSAPGVKRLRVPSGSTERKDVRVWRYTGPALDEGDECANWFSRVLGRECRLVRFPDDAHRAVSRKYTKLEAETAFADGYPALITTLESLSELNRRLDVPVPMHRFRPNIVLRDCQPFEEDTWSQLEGEHVLLDLVKPCDRCTAITVNHETLERGKEPLQTLAAFRRSDRGVIFGQNAIVRAKPPGATQVLHVGEKLQIRGHKQPIKLITA